MRRCKASANEHWIQGLRFGVIHTGSRSLLRTITFRRCNCPECTFGWGLALLRHHVSLLEQATKFAFVRTEFAKSKDPNWCGLPFFGHYHVVPHVSLPDFCRSSTLRRVIGKLILIFQLHTFRFYAALVDQTFHPTRSLSSSTPLAC